MSFKKKAVHELEVFGLAWLYFAFCFLVLVALKKMILAQYQIGFYGLSVALVGALIVAKVVLVLELVPLGGWVQRQPAVVDVTLRTVLYCVGVLIAMVLEHGFEQRHEYGGFANAIVSVVEQRNLDRILATTIAVGGTILVFNLYAALRMGLGKGVMMRIFLKTPLKELEVSHATAKPE